MMAKQKPKYKKDTIVYCRPWMVSGTGFLVYKCKVLKIGYVGNSPYYDLEIIEGGKGNLYIRYESEMSKRPERLVKEAKKAVKDKYIGYLQSFEYYMDKLDKI